MSSWISFVGGMLNVTPARYDDADQSVNRLPTERMTSAEAASSLPDDDAVSPMVRPASSCVSSIAPLPFQVVTTGAPSRSARAVTSADASAVMAPPPATMTGRFAVAQQGRGPFDVVGGRPDPAACLALRRVGEGDLGAVGQDVHRHVEQDRSGPAGDHLVPGPVQDERQLVDARRLPPLLDDRLEDPRVVGDVASLELLEQAGAAHVRVGRAGQQRHRGRVDVGRGHPDDRVGRPRADAGEGQDRLAGGPVEPVGQVDRGLLVHDLHGPDRVLPVEQGIGQRPAAVARDPGHDRDALAHQVLDHDLRPGQSPTTLRLGQRDPLALSM